VTRIHVLKPRSDLATQIEDYLRACRSRGVRPSTIKHSYGYSLRSVLLPWCAREGIGSVADIDARVLERFAVEQRERTTKEGKPLSEATVWTHVKSTNQLLRWWAAEHDGKAPQIRLRKPPGRKVDVLDRDQIAGLERAAVTVRDRVIVRLLADTAMRPGELVSITGADLHSAGRRHYVRVTGKTGLRDVPVTPEMFTRLRGLARGAHDPIFVGLRKDRRTGEHEALQVGAVRQMVSMLALDAGIRTTVNPYVLRHSACHWLLMSGESTIVVERIMGHGSEAMIRQHYANLGIADSHDRLMSLLRAER
jgi:integrase